MDKISIKEQIEKILTSYQELLYATLGDVTISPVTLGSLTITGVVTRKATDKDHLELLQNEWVNVVEALYELGIEIEEE